MAEAYILAPVMRTQVFYVLVCLVVSGLASSIAVAQKKTSQSSRETNVGVLVSDVINASPEMGAYASEAMAAALQKMLLVKAVVGAKEIIPAAKGGGVCIADTACLQSVGTALEVDELLILIVVGIGDELKIEATWVQVNTGKTSIRRAVNVPRDPDEMALALQAQAKVVLPDTRVRPQIVVVPELSSQVPTIAPQRVNSTSQGRSWTPVSKTLLVGGAVATGAALGFGVYRLAECGGFQCTEVRSGLSTAADVVGVLGIVTLATATVLYLGSKQEEPVSGIGVLVGRQSSTFTYSGSF